MTNTVEAIGPCNPEPREDEVQTYVDAATSHASRNRICTGNV